MRVHDLLSATSKRFTIEPRCFHIGQSEVLVQMGLVGAVGGGGGEVRGGLIVLLTLTLTIKLLLGFDLTVAVLQY